MEPTTHTAIEVKNLVRIYDTTIGVLRRTHRQIVALDGISFTVSPGELFGLVGPNGAGKTTLIKILSTLLLPTQGEAYVNGWSVWDKERKIRERINVVFGGERGLYTRLSGEDNIKFFANLYQVPRDVAHGRVPELLKLVGLEDRGKERVEGYSKGMKQRLHIAKSLINDPDILFLDEPTIGLDPEAAHKLRQIVLDLKGLGKSIILTSHYMHEVDVLCERVGVINKGRLLTLDSPYRLKRHVAELFVIEARIRQGQLENSHLETLKNLDSVSRVTLSAVDQFQLLSIHTYAPDDISDYLQKQLQPEDIGYLITREPTLEDAYLKLIGSDL